MVEIRLEPIQAASMPKDCFVSVRVGDVQKISRLAPSRVYRFPPALDRKHGGKIEVFHRIGSYNLDISGSQPAAYDEVSIDCEASGFGSLGVKLALERTQPTKLPRKEEPATKPGGRVRAAKEYLSEHSLEDRLSQAMQRVLCERPRDPFLFLVAELRAFSLAPQEREETQEQPREQEFESKPSVGTWLMPHQNVGWQVARLRADLQASQSEVEELQRSVASKDAELVQLRSKGEATASEAAGRPSQVDRNVEERLAGADQRDPAADSARRPEAGKAGEVSFILALKAEYLGGVAGAVGEFFDTHGTHPDYLNFEEQVRNSGDRAATIDRVASQLGLEKSVETKVDLPRNLMAEARANFVQAALGGKPAQVLSDAETDGLPIQPASSAPRQTDPEVLKALKAQARAGFVQASIGGQLAQALNPEASSNTTREAQAEKVKALKAHARQNLVEASINGHLAQALSEASKESLRARGRDTLIDACRKGLLKSVIREVCGESAEEKRIAAIKEEAAEDSRLQQAVPKDDSRPESKPDIRARARDALLQASMDGSLRSALAQLPSEDDLRMRARDVMMQAAMDGRLTSALAEMQQTDENPENNMRSSLEVRAKARDVLMEAERNGELASAIARLRSPDNDLRSNEDDMRSKVSQVLLEASRHGALASSLAEMQPASNPKDLCSQEDDMRSKVSQVLLEASRNGALASAVAELQPASNSVNDFRALAELPSVSRPPAEELRARAREVMVKAAMEGRLTSALAELPSFSRPDAKELRARARDAMMQAATDGSLTFALAELPAFSQVSENNLHEVSTPEGAAHRGIVQAQAKAKARSAVLQAASDGRLSAALGQIKKS
eukprot:TRINITY_DN5724_c0_g1_i2.p1 TRINITY_DN5724_c0_g1~~TRINITY_DN5724_c0_g1_i2.p1  ORF type:complete len:858 (+),score=162.50 TRINITY_DN5724_c0_g1_i2:27-2576(+)